MLCTSGTAAANYHPAICEADESAVPLIALTADRPPELRGIGAGQTIDQIKLYGSSVRWFCEVGTHDGRRRRPAALPLGRLPGACRRPGRAAPRPGSPQPALARAARTDRRRGRGHRDRSAGARGSRRATADRGDADRPGALGLPPRRGRRAHRRRDLRGDRRRPPARPGAARAAGRTSPQAAGFPILAEPTSQLRCGPHDRSHVISTYDHLLRDERFRDSVVPDLVLRFGEMPTSKPLRTWLAASGADQIVVDPRCGWNEPTRRAAALLRADPTELAVGLGCTARRRTATGAVDAGSMPRRRHGRRSRPSWTASTSSTEPGAPPRPRAAPTATATSSTPPRACRSATRRPSCRRARPTPSSSATAAPTASTAWSPQASAPPKPAAGRPRSSPATSASSTTSAASPPCATSPPRSASSSSTTTAAASSASSRRREALAGKRVRGPPRHPARRRRRPKRAALFGLPHRRLDALDGSARRPCRRHRPDRGTRRPPGERRAAPPPQPTASPRRCPRASSSFPAYRDKVAAPFSQAARPASRPGPGCRRGRRGGCGTEWTLDAHVPSAFISMIESPKPTLAEFGVAPVRCGERRCVRLTGPSWRRSSSRAARDGETAQPGAVRIYDIEIGRRVDLSSSRCEPIVRSNWRMKVILDAVG